MQIPGVGRVSKKVSLTLGDLKKKEFNKYIHTHRFKINLTKKLETNKIANFELVTFTNSANFLDFLLSILSFIDANGLPKKWTVYADDEFSPFQKSILATFNFLIFKNWFENVSENNVKLYGGKWQFRKYLSFSSHIFTTTTIFLDSDILFYPLFDIYKDYIVEGNWYLPDPVEAFSIDEEIIGRDNYKRNMYIINSGFIVLNNIPPWNVGMQYLTECLQNDYVTHFTEQSAINIMYLNDANAKVLEPRVFHVSTKDHFTIGFLKTNNLAMRHYVGLIRHKMWQAGWKQFV